MDSAEKNLIQERSGRNSPQCRWPLRMFPVATDAEHHRKQLSALVATSQPQRSQQTPRSLSEWIYNSSASTWGGGKAPLSAPWALGQLMWSHSKATTPRSSLNSQLPPGSELRKGGSGKTNWLKAHVREMMQRKCLRQKSIGRAHPTRSSEDPECRSHRGFWDGAAWEGESGRAAPIPRCWEGANPGNAILWNTTLPHGSLNTASIKWAIPTEIRGRKNIGRNGRDINVYTEYLEDAESTEIK